MSRDISLAIDNAEDMINTESKSSSDNKDRKELLWERREEIHLQTIIDDCEVQSRMHRRKGKRFKKLYATFGVPAILIPLILSGLTDQLTPYPLAHSLLMILVGIISGVSSFFNFGAKYQSHYDFENKYSGLAGDIKVELCKPKAHRVACDVYLERVRLMYSGLNTQAPEVETPTVRRRAVEKK